MRTTLRAWALSVLLVPSLACGGGDTTEAPGYPAGTVLAVAGEAISADEVDAVAARVALLYPTRSKSFLRQGALESFLLPRAAVRAAYAEARATAQADCEAAIERARAGEFEDVETHRGTAEDLTLTLWAMARELEPGEWSAPYERIGSFSLVQLVEREGFRTRPSEEFLTVRVVEFGYLPVDFAPDDLDAALAAATLEILDPAYRDLVPEALRYQMKERRTP